MSAANPALAQTRAPRTRCALWRLPGRAAAAAVATLLGALVTLGLTAVPAAAGGPTSVLVVNYDGSRAGAALTGSAAYDDLVRALDAMAEPVGETRPRAEFMSHQIRLTWLIHDVTPWRVDALSIAGDDVWVSTAMSHDGSDIFSTPAVWHRPKDGPLLIATLTRLGVIGDAPREAAPTAGGAAPAAQPARSVATPQPGTTGFPWWLTVAVGIVALGVGTLLRRTVRRTTLPDGAPAPGGPASGMPSASGADPASRISTYGPPDDASRPTPVGFTPDGGSGRR